MNKPKKLDSWDFSDNVHTPNCYDFKSVPDITRDNFNTLLEHYNNLVDVVNALCEKNGMETEK